MANNYSNVEIQNFARIMAQDAAIYHIYFKYGREEADYFRRDLELISPILNNCQTLAQLLQAKLVHQGNSENYYNSQDDLFATDRLRNKAKEMNVMLWEYLDIYFDACCRGMGVIPGLVRASEPQIVAGRA